MSCEHTEDLPEAVSFDAAAGCAGCRELGVDDWAHLRACLTCGYVGCCDSSEHRHASVHHERSAHPVMRSAEPGEQWRWCFVHQRLV